LFNFSYLDSLPGIVPESNQWRTVTYVPTIAASIVVQIKSSELTFVKNIGSGSFGEVWRGRWRASDVAIKQVRNDSVTDASRSVEIEKDFILLPLILFLFYSFYFLILFYDY